MSPLFLNSLMVANLNGPKVQEFDGVAYATEYVKEHGRCDVWKRGRKRKISDVDGNDDEVFEDDIADEDKGDVEEVMEVEDKKVLIGKSFLF